MANFFLWTVIFVKPAILENVVKMTPHTLPKLPYAYDALEPYLDVKTMEIHHTKHHQAYVNNLNAAIEKYPQFGDETASNLLRHLETIPEEIREIVKNNAGGHFNHFFFWQIMRPQGGGSPEGALAEAITKTFESYENFKELFTKTAVSRFGSGWAWLCLTPLGGIEVLSTPNQDSPLIEGKTPILGLDVWEHAYYLKYQNRRPEYVAAWWNVVNWEKVAENYSIALSALKPTP